MQYPTIILLARITLVGLLAGCPPQDRLVLIPANEAVRTAPLIRDACRVTEEKCSKCHDLERIKLAHHALVDWPSYVEKMRLQPGSGISQGDKPTILRCLTHLSQRQRDLEVHTFER